MDIGQTKPWSERYVVREPNHLFSDLHATLSVHHVRKSQTNVRTQSQVWKPFLPSGKAFWSHSSDNLKHKFSVIMDECSRLKVPKMLFPMRDADLHRNPIGTERLDFYLEQWVCYFGKTEESTSRQRRFLDVRSCTNVLWQGKCFVGTDSRASSLVEEAIRGHKATMTATALEHPDMGAQECASNAREDVRGYSHYNMLWEDNQIWTAGSLHQNTNHVLQYKRNLWMRTAATTSRGCRTQWSTFSVGRTRTVCPEL